MQSSDVPLPGFQSMFESLLCNTCSSRHIFITAISTAANQTCQENKGSLASHSYSKSYLRYLQLQLQQLLLRLSGDEDRHNKIRFQAFESG